MTEREKRNEELKREIRRNAEVACQYIDLMEAELRHRETMCQSFAEKIDELTQPQQGKQAAA